MKRVTTLLFLTCIFLAGCATAKFTQTGNTYPAYSGHVKVLRSPPKNCKYEEIGWVSSSGGMIHQWTHLAEAMQKKAASKGANAIVVISGERANTGMATYNQQFGFVGGYGTQKSLTAIAIRILDDKPDASNIKVPPHGTKKTGTGFAISPNGHIVTAFHIVQDASKIEACFKEGKWVSATLLKHSKSNDVAILKIQNLTPSFLKLGNIKSVKQGDEVFTMGYPVTHILGEEPKYTEGTISSLSGIGGESALLQITVPVQPGNSGGPLVNENGEVVGLVTSTAAVTTFFAVTGTLPQNISWAIKVSYIKLLYEQEEVNQLKTASMDNITHVCNSVCMIRTE